MGGVERGTRGSGWVIDGVRWLELGVKGGSC